MLRPGATPTGSPSVMVTSTRRPGMGRSLAMTGEGVQGCRNAAR